MVITDARIARRLREGRNGWHGTSIPAAGAQDITYARTILNDPCSYCNGLGGVIDHINPAEHGWTNLTGACKRCNTSKGQLPLLRHLLAKRLRGERETIKQQLQALGHAHGPRSHAEREAA